MAVNMSVNLCGVTLKNPVIAASGTFAFGGQHSWFIDVNQLGGIALKSITLEKRIGNPPPRIAETASGIINSVGLQNPGIDGFFAETMKEVKALETVVIANIAGSRIEEYVAVAERLNDAPVAMLELNISCPNVKLGGASLGTDPVCGGMHARSQSCYQEAADCQADACSGRYRHSDQSGGGRGADAVSLINTLPAMAVDVHTRRPVLGNVTGGLSDLPLCQWLSRWFTTCRRPSAFRWSGWEVS